MQSHEKLKREIIATYNLINGYTEIDDVILKNLEYILLDRYNVPIGKMSLEKLNRLNTFHTKINK